MRRKEQEMRDERPVGKKGKARR